MCSPTLSPKMIDCSNRRRRRQVVSFTTALPEIHVVERLDLAFYQRSDYARFRQETIEEAEAQTKMMMEKRRMKLAEERQGNGPQRLPGRRRTFPRASPSRRQERNSNSLNNENDQGSEMASMETMRNHARKAASKTTTASTAIKRATAA